MQNERIKYDILADDSKINYADNTKKLIGNRALLVILAFVCALVMDIVVIVTIAAKESFGIQYAVPIIMLIVDISFLIVSCFCNARANYYKYISIAYVVVTILLSIIAVLSLGIGSAVIMTKMAAVLYIVSHVAVALILLALLATTKRKLSVKTLVAMATIVVLSLGTVGALSYYYVDSGVWGQNNERTVVYELSSDNNSYVAIDILNGKSSSVIIPDTFDGKPVKAIDISMLANNSINSLTIQGEEFKGLVNTQEIDSAEIVGYSRISDIQVDKNLVDDYRQLFYQFAVQENSGKLGYNSNSIVNLINDVRPYNLANDERYLSFCYDWSALESNVDKIPPLEDNQIVKAGSKAQPVSAWLSSQLEYYSTRAGLISAYYDNNRVVMKNAVGNKSILNSPIMADTVVNVTFEKVYRVTVHSNDSLFKGDEHYNIPDGRGGNATYFTASSSASIYNQLSQRTGLSVDNICNNMQMLGYSSFVDLLTKSNGNMIIDRNWSVNAPIINSVTLSKDGYQYVYGDQVLFNIDAARPKGIEYIYTLQNESGYVLAKKTNEEGGIALEKMLPTQSGTYKLSVHAKAINSSLIGSTGESRTFYIRIAKKTLNVEWTVPNGMVYNGYYQNISGTISQDQAVYGDNIDYSVYDNSAKDAGKHTATLALLAGSLDKYIIAPQQNKRDYTIAKFDTSVVWNRTRAVYNGQYQYPEYTAKNVAGTELPMTIDENPKNAGEYLLKATCANSADRINYNLENNTCAYVVDKKEVVPTFGNDRFVYNGYQQYPSIVSASGFVNSDNINNSISYSGTATNAGSYTLRATSTNNNYYIDDSKSFCAYTIDKKEISPVFGATTLMYNGKAQSPGVQSLSGLASNDTFNSIVGTIIFKGINTNAGSYTYTVELPANSNYKFSSDSVSTSYAINKANLTISAKNASKTYDGQPFSMWDYEIVGKISTDYITDIGRISYGGNAVNAVNASSSPYTISISCDSSGNKANNYNITCKSAELRINKANLTISAKNASKTYDGQPFSMWDYEIVGKISTDYITDIGRISYGGNAVNAVNASSSPYTISISCDSSGNKANNYNITCKSAELRINKANTSIVWGATTFTYNNSPQSPTIVIQGTEYVGEDMDIAYTYYDSQGKTIAKPSAVGNYTVKVACTSANYNYSNVQIDFVINAVEVNQ